MDIFEKIYQRARSDPRKIVLPEGDEPRVIKAAADATEKNLARIVLLGKEEDILKKAGKDNLDIEKIEIIDPQKDQAQEDYIKSYWQLRKHRGMTLELARDLLMQNFVYYAAMMLRQGWIDGFVAGARYKTSEVIRATLHCLDMDASTSTASGAFLVKIKDRDFGEGVQSRNQLTEIGHLPSKEQLAEIAITSAELWTELTGFKGRLAMLSFSSGGSSSAPAAYKVREATEIVRKARPDLLIDGELQVDSAVVPSVAKIKVPQSPLAGRANILIFPNLEAGNIAYKLLQRLAHARVVGPLLQGLTKPVSDLSRGCSPQEIIDAIAVTVVRAQ